MKISTKYPALLIAVMLLAVTIVSPTFAKSPIEQIIVSINGVESTVPLNSANVTVPTPKQANFTKIEQISGIYLDVDSESINTSTLTGHFLMLSPPFYLNGNHQLQAMYGTFTKNQSSNTSRIEYQTVYYGIWQWVADEQDTNKVLIRLGKDERHWYTLWVIPQYTVYFRDTLHVTTNNLGKFNTAKITVLGHEFSKIWV